jgi:glycosyltransferase involved in cell wall biosynthesis
MNGLNIALLAHLYYPISEPYHGGLEMHTHMLAQELRARGHRVTMFAKAGSTGATRNVMVMPKSFTFRKHTNAFMRQVQEKQITVAESFAINAVRHGNFDFVINNSLGPLPYIHLRDKPMLTLLHTPAADLPHVCQAIARRWKPSPFHAYASVSETNAGGWRELLPHVAVVPNGIHLTTWQKAPGRPVPGRAVWTARITPEKGLHVAIAAAKCAGMALHFAGPISDKDYFKKIIKPQLSDNIRYAGHLNHNDLPAFLASGEAFIASPLWEEPFGLSVVEAIATGTPVAALPRGAMKEIVSEDAGTVAADNTVAALSQAITEARQKNRAACKRAAHSYSVTSMVNNYEIVMTSLLTAYARATAAKPAPHWSLSNPAHHLRLEALDARRLAMPRVTSKKPA